MCYQYVSEALHIPSIYEGGADIVSLANIIWSQENIVKYIEPLEIVSRAFVL
jgi:hypothetical protein